MQHIDVLIVLHYYPILKIILKVNIFFKKKNISFNVQKKKKNNNNNNNNNQSK